VTAHERVAPLLLPALQRFQNENLQASIKFIASPALLKLEYGEAHVAIRSGPKPEQPDNIVQPFLNLRFALYAHESYVSKHGIPNSVSDFDGHRFVCWELNNSVFPFTTWLGKNVPTESKVLVTANQGVAEQSVLIGMGIGLYPEPYARHLSDLIEVLPSQPDWFVPLWLVTHVDLHRTLKVQALLKILKET
jgi:DNA-binding transcriptional LysR family regulator